MIKRGTPPEEDRYSFTCSRCNSILEFGQEDVKRDNGDGPYCPTPYVVCPVCKAFVLWWDVSRPENKVGTSLGSIPPR